MKDVGVGIVCLLIGLVLGAALIYGFVKAPPLAKCPANAQLDKQSNVCVVSCPSGSKWESEFLNCVSDTTLEELPTMHGRNYDGRQVRIRGYLTLVSVENLEIFGLKREYTFVLANNTSGLENSSWIFVHWTIPEVPHDVTASLLLQKQVEVIGTVHFIDTQKQISSGLMFSSTPEIQVDKIMVLSGVGT